MLEFSRCGGTARQPQRSEPCQCVSGQPRTCHRPLKGETQSLQCAAVVQGPALGAAAGLGRRLVVGGADSLTTAGVFYMWRCRSTATTHRALPVCEWPALGMPWASAGSNTAHSTNWHFLRADQKLSGDMKLWKQSDVLKRRFFGKFIFTLCESSWKSFFEGSRFKFYNRLSSWNLYCDWWMIQQ